jgi:hypothetical protein
MLKLTDHTPLNAMVIDVKDDHGNITFKTGDDRLDQFSKNYIPDIDQLMSTLEQHEVYPIAWVTVFKDSVLAESKPEWSFLENGDVWENNRGEAFVNPFLKEVWDYNIEVAKLAAEKGFQEIQFDYVRFPEGFEKLDQDLEYEWGEYGAEKRQKEAEDVETMAEKGDYARPRVDAVTDFVAYAKKELDMYDVDVSVDIFGYSATEQEAPGIGQNFSSISEHVDVISSMIYPSHWGEGYFGIDNPDKEPYKLAAEYMKVEKKKLEQLDNPPVSRPWLQDFTATWLGKGNYTRYGVHEVEEQIKALNEAGVWEYLLWNANDNYTEDVNYFPVGPPEEKVLKQKKRSAENN